MITPEFKLYIQKYLLVLIVLVLIPSISYGIWLFYPKRNLDVLVIDKSVPDDSYQEHQSLFWVLEYSKYTKNDGELYRKDLDYQGFFPDNSADHGVINDLGKLSDSQIKEKVSGMDLIYLADTYGVFENNFEKESREDFSKKIYGGMDESDLKLLREAGTQEKTIVAEFNSMASPTPKAIRSEFENMMGLKWTGWISRYFDEMDTLANEDIPAWLISQYLQQHDNQWVSPGPALVFVRDDGRVEAFSFQQDYLNKIPLIRTQRVNEHGFNLPEVVPYPDWFDIVLIEREYEVISYYDINPTADGLEKLREMGLPRFFPAAVYKENGKGRFYYLSGDFSDLRSDLGSAKFTGLPFLWRAYHIVSDHTDRQSFFWNYYFPLTSGIFEKAYKGKN
jgi:hypothetical protein